MHVIQRLPIVTLPSFSIAELVRIRRAALRTARSFPTGPERNQRRQIAASIATLMKNAEMLSAREARQRAFWPWKLIDSAPYNLDLELGVVDDDGPRALVFMCRRLIGGWFNAKTGARVDVHPTHWREWRRAS